MLREGNEVMSTIPGLNQIQFEGFCKFIDQGLTEELDKFPKIEDTDQEIEFQLFVETYQLVEPLIKERDAVYELLTYSSEFYVSAGLIWKSGRDMQKQTIFIGNIPIMNSLGTFIVNGIYRILINQILQSPGIYYRSELDHKGISVYTGTIISDWGGRLELEIDRKARIWARVSRKQKISILVLLSAMGLNLREIIENVCYPEMFLSFLNDKEKQKIGSKENAILEFYQQFASVGGDPVFSESVCKELQKKFFQQKCELGRIGRRNMNRRLNLDIPQNNTFLLPRDILAAADHLIEMKFGMDTLDDMNHLKNKRIRSVADLLQDQFGLALVRLKNAVKGTIKGTRSGGIRHKLIPTPQNLVTSTPLTTTYESFFGLHPLSQVLDRTNPLTQIVHGRKLSYLGPGGLTGRTANFKIRDIHPSHYGRICPIDTPEGINVGLIRSLAIHARIGHLGSLESPFFEISKRSKSKKIRMLFLSPSRDEYYMVAAGNSLTLNQDIQEEQVVPARYRQEFLTIAWERVHLRSIFPFQYFSIGASLIPFIEHNDANRALMSSNMQRQAVPLSRSEKCIVGTGLERQVALDSGVLAIAEREGKINYIDTDKILLSINGYTLSIPLVMYQRSNKNTCMSQKAQVQPGKYIKKGQLLADGSSTVGGELALGKNILVAYMPWEGYNFEDAVLISERLVYEDIYTSFHIKKIGNKDLCDKRRPGKDHQRNTIYRSLFTSKFRQKWNRDVGIVGRDRRCFSRKINTSDGKRIVVCPRREIIARHTWHKGIHFKGNLSKITYRWLGSSYGCEVDTKKGGFELKSRNHKCIYFTKTRNQSRRKSSWKTRKKRYHFKNFADTRYALFARRKAYRYGLQPIRSTLANECRADLGMFARVCGKSARKTLSNITVRREIRKRGFQKTSFFGIIGSQKANKESMAIRTRVSGKKQNLGWKNRRSFGTTCSNRKALYFEINSSSRRKNTWALQWALYSCYTTTRERKGKARRATGRRNGGLGSRRIWCCSYFTRDAYLKIGSYESPPRSTWYYNNWRNNTETGRCSRIISITRSRTTIFGSRTESFPCIREEFKDE
nr:RNA polymerase betasubunit [Tetraena hamiensis var. qatarensis]